MMVRRERERERERERMNGEYRSFILFCVDR
jgi:hypothetical protein